MKNLMFVFILVFTLTSCKQKIEGVKNITATELQTILKEDKNVQLLDVRTPSECAEGTIETALEISVTTDGFTEKAIAKLDKSKPVYVYCRSGGRSLVASKILKDKGYKVYNVEGGYMSWLDLK